MPYITSGAVIALISHRSVLAEDFVLDRLTDIAVEVNLIRILSECTMMRRAVLMTLRLRLITRLDMSDINTVTRRYVRRFHRDP